MNVIAIYSSPQECGDDSLRFVSCETGEIILDICLSPEDDFWERKITRIILSPIDTFFDLCTVQRYQVGHGDKGIPHIIGRFADPECTIPMYKTDSPFWKKYGKESLTILGVKDLGITSRPIWTEERIKETGRQLHIWQYIVAKVENKVDDVYHPELDTVFQEIKEKCGIECPPEDRYDIQTLALRISEALGYKMLNLIYG